MRKISIALVISLSQLVCLMTTSIVAPALPQIAADLHLGESKAQIAFSIFVLGQAFGPFVIAPMSEVFGRKPVWIAGTLFYILWNSLCPVGKSQAVLIVGRLLSGAGGSCGVIVSSFLSHHLEF
jgi:MFS family permease